MSNDIPDNEIKAEPTNGTNRVKKDRTGKRFQKGNRASVGKGRPKVHLCIPDILRLIADQPIPDELKSDIPEAYIKKSPTALKAMCQIVYRQALRGKPWAVQWVAERMEGKAKEHVTVAADGGMTSLSGPLVYVCAKGDVPPQADTTPPK